MALSATQKKRLEEIGAFLIEEGFSDILADANLLPKLHVLDRVRTSMLTTGSNTKRICNVLTKMGTTGEAFAFFAAHRPDLFTAHERSEFAATAHGAKNKKVHFDSQTANKLLAKLDGKTKFEPLPYLVTPFASYYRANGKDKVAKLYHVHSIMEIHSDLQIVREVIVNANLKQSHFLAIICEFADFIVDYFSDSELPTLRKTDSGVLFSAKHGTLLTDVKKVLKHENASVVAEKTVTHWLSNLFENKILLYDLYSWQWSGSKAGVSYQDIEPIVQISDREKKTILTFFTALAKNDEQTAAACVISMCESTDASLDLAERLVSGHHYKQRHVFESGIAILEDALNEGMHIKPTFAKIAASGAQLIFIVKQYVPHDKEIFNLLNSYLATHDILLQQIMHQAINNEKEAQMTTNKTNNSNQTQHTHTHSDSATYAIEKLAKEIDKSSNRIAYSALIAAFTIAGALLVSSATESGLLMLGVPFFVIAFLSSLLLISSIVKEPK